MCVIIRSPDKCNRPSLATLRACEAQNRDGSGVAWIRNGKVRYTKGLSADEIHDLLKTKKGEVVIHFRFATAGGKSTKLCHPFPISATARPREVGDESEVLFHNGHWSGWVDFLTDNNIKLDGPVSDTRVAAIGTYLGGKGFLKTLPGRFVLMTSTEVSLFGDWEELDGMQFSNLLWTHRLPPKPVRAAKIAKPAKKATQPELWPASQPISRPSKVYTGQRNIREAMICYGD